MIKVLNIVNGVREAILIRKSAEISEEIIDRVKLIIENVSKFGDKSVFSYTEKLDRVKLKNLRVTTAEITRAYENVTRKQKNSLIMMRERLARNELELSKRFMNLKNVYDGIKFERIPKPLNSVGCYIPGGMARYPSTVIMCAIPAKIAKVKKIVMVSPPLKDGTVDPLSLVAADMCGVDEIYKIGGAQAVAALAYGTETIPRVDKIVGPGGNYVNIAKILVSKNVGIDMVAGPTELVIYADETADTNILCRDLIAQAEHSPDTLCGVVTLSKIVSNEIKGCLRNLISKQSLPRKEIIRKSLSNNSFIALCKNKSTALAFINEIAPEHLEIICRKPKFISSKISSAGIVLEGPFTAASASDFCLGSNHILPTNQVARYRGGLSVLDFVKIVSHISATRKALQFVEPFVREVAFLENLPNHYEAIKERLCR